MTILGILLFAAAVLAMAGLYWTGPRRHRYPSYGLLGIAVIVIAEVMLFRGSLLVRTFFTPIVWTGYIAAVDAAVAQLSSSIVSPHPGL